MLLTVVLSIASLFTALLSGVFGMAGGMILMGVYTAFLPVPTAMVMHGGTQLASNVSRAVLLYRHVHWRGFGFYVIGAVLAFLALYSVQLVPHPLVVFLGLGLAPFVAPLLPSSMSDFERPRTAVATGLMVAALQLLAGAAGPLLDVAFLNTRLTRQQVVATKAVTQVFSHSLKLVYFIPALERGLLSPALLASVLVATVVGTRLGTYALTRMSDASFRRYSRMVVYGIGAAYLCRAGMVMLP